MTARLARKIDRQAWMKFFTHLMVILLIFLLPDLMMRASFRHKSASSLYIWLLYGKTAVYLGVFYLNYYLLIGRMLMAPKHRRILSYVLVNLAIVISLTALMYLVQYWVLWGDDWAARGYRRVILRTGSFFLRDLGMMALTVGLSVALRFGENWSKIEQRHEQMLASQRTEELENLKNQVNPHFLFNTLNTIYALIAVSPERAQEAVHQLSALLRYVLYENPATVPLSREVNFLKNYLALMAERLPADMVEATFNVGPDPEIPPLIFVALIENAMKYGNTGVKGQPIQISVTADAEGTIVCETTNHFLENKVNETKGGIGLANLRRRLHLIYGDQAELIASPDGDVFHAKLTIKANQYDTPALLRD